MPNSPKGAFETIYPELYQFAFANTTEDWMFFLRSIVHNTLYGRQRLAERLGQESVLIELNPDYWQMARGRITADGSKVECALP